MITIPNTDTKMIILPPPPLTYNAPPAPPFYPLPSLADQMHSFVIYYT